MSEAAAADAGTSAEAVPEATTGPFTPPALEQAFNRLVEIGVSPRQMRVIEIIFDAAIAEIIQHALHNRPADLAVLMRWLHHLRIEPDTPTTALMSGAHEIAPL